MLYNLTLRVEEREDDQKNVGKQVEERLKADLNLKDALNRTNRESACNFYEVNPVTSIK